MAEYIEREAFMHFLVKQHCENCDKRKGMKNGKKCFVYKIGDAPCRSCGVDDALDYIECFPSADVQPVVRCKDCQYWQESRYGIIEMNACLRFDSPLEKDGFIFKANAEDFCSFAKRRVEA